MSKYSKEDLEKALEIKPEEGQEVNKHLRKLSEEIKKQDKYWEDRAKSEGFGSDYKK